MASHHMGCHVIKDGSKHTHTDQLGKGSLQQVVVKKSPSAILGNRERKTAFSTSTNVRHRISSVRAS